MFVSFTGPGEERILASRNPKLEKRTMDIKVTKEQYEKLLHLTYLGNWIVNAYRTEDFLEEYNAEAERIYSYAPAFGFKDKIEFDELEGRTFPGAKLEEDLDELVEDYDDWSFWDLLILKLAERDTVREYGQAAVDHMTDEELEAKRAPYVKKYEKEIDAHGIENLEIYKIS